MTKKLIFLFVAVFMVGFTGCPSSQPTLPSTTSGGGFFFSTFTSFNLSPPQVTPVTQIKGTWVRDQAGATGDPTTWIQTSNAAGIGIVSNGRIKADWKFEWTFSPVSACDGQTVTANVPFVDADVNLVCTVTTVVLGATADFVFSPMPIITDGSSGTEAFISGSSFSSQYGMPLLQYFDLNGNLVAQASADGVANDGSWMSSPIPDISQLSIGTYVGFISNANTNGGYDLLGSVAVQVVSPSLPPPTDPCPTNPCIAQN